jgi:hypothetical protein
MWDNRLSKRNPKAPDFKCRDRSCDGVIWPARPGAATNGRETANRRTSFRLPTRWTPHRSASSLDDIPF